MKIGVLTYGVYGDRMTGISRYAVEITRALRQLEPTLEIVLLNPNPESNHPWYAEFPTYPLPALKRLPLVATLGNWQLQRAAKDLDLDVLHDPCGIAPFLTPPGRRTYGRVTTVHDAIPAIYPRTQPILTRAVFATLVRLAGRTADAILTVSQASADDLVRCYGIPAQKLHVVHLGTHQPAPPVAGVVTEHLKRLKVGRPFLLYVGALHPRKNLARVVEAFAILRASGTEAQLVIVGPPTWGADSAVRKLLARAGDGVSFTGFVSDGALEALYAGADALVFPSLYEGFGLPALEAMSHGTPVIASNVSSLPEVVGNAGLLVDPLSVDAIADAMRRVLLDPALRADLAERGKRRSLEFGWDTAARRTYDVYRSVARS